jgi:hypothetical protein
MLPAALDVPALSTLLSAPSVAAQDLDLRRAWTVAAVPSPSRRAGQHAPRIADRHKRVQETAPCHVPRLDWRRRASGQLRAQLRQPERQHMPEPPGEVSAPVPCKGLDRF